MSELQIKKGDFISIKNTGGIFPCFTAWAIEHSLINYSGNLPVVKPEYEVISKGPHGDSIYHGELLGIKDPTTNKHYIIENDDCWIRLIKHHNTSKQLKFIF